MDQIFMDSSFIIALARESDEKHERAMELRKSFDSGTAFVLSDHILGEVVTFLSKRDNKEIAYKTGIALLQSSDVRMVYAEENEVKSSIEALKKMDGISFCDSLSVIMMEKHKIKKILSFDSDFDRFPRIERVF